MGMATCVCISQHTSQHTIQLKLAVRIAASDKVLTCQNEMFYSTELSVCQHRISPRYSPGKKGIGALLLSVPEFTRRG